MKYIFLLIGFLGSMAASAQTGYDIKVKIKGLSCGSELMLANHFADKQYLRDTSECENGVFHFKGDEPLETGVYLIVLPDKNYVEVLMSEKEDQTQYYFEGDTALNIEDFKVSGSKENEEFLKFNIYAREMGLKARAIQAEMKDAETDEEKQELRDELVKLGEQVAVKRSEVSKANPELFIGRLYKSMEDVALADVPEGLDETEARTYRYLWMRNHYWDNVDMSEDGLVRSPVFHNKLKFYVENYLTRMPDTAIMVMDKLIKRVEEGGSYAQYKYTVQYLLKHFTDVNYMCFDKCLYHLAKNYYCAGKTEWSDSARVATMCEESAKMEPTLCDVTAPDLNMPDTTFGRRIRMSEITTPVTVIVMWDIDCGHCKKEMPIIKSYYDSADKSHVEIYAVYTKGDWDGWRERIRKENYKFINVANAFGEDDYREEYNIRSTPQIYVLDRNKVIRFKKIAASDIKNAVQYLLEEQGIIEMEE